MTTSDDSDESKIRELARADFAHPTTTFGDSVVSKLRELVKMDPSRSLFAGGDVKAHLSEDGKRVHCTFRIQPRDEEHEAALRELGAVPVSGDE